MMVAEQSLWLAPQKANVSVPRLSQDVYVQTTKGWIEMNRLTYETQVICSDGSIEKIVDIHPEGIKPIYRVTFSDGRLTHCATDRLWKVYNTEDDVGESGRLLATDQIQKRLCAGQSLFIDLPLPCQTPDVHLADSPGTMARKICRLKHHKRVIPHSYMKASPKQKLALLQGFLSAGCVLDEGGDLQFQTPNVVLAKQIQDLVRSLGGVARLIQTNAFIHTVSIQLHDHSHCFRLGISKIDYVQDDDVVSITIGHPDQLYITDDYIVTCGVPVF